MDVPATDASTGARTQPAADAAADAAARLDLVGIGASAGGVEALRRLVGALPAEYRGTLFVVMHIGPDANSTLPAILSRAGPLPATHASDLMPVEAGRILVAPPDHHLLAERGGVVRVVRGPRENRHRPAIDPLFRSLAWTYGPRAVGVVLTGNLDDGTAGLWALKSCGGTTIVQEPNEADHPQMPINALMHNRIDHRLPLEEIAALLVKLALQAPDAQPRQSPPGLEAEVEYSKLQRSLHHAGGLGRLSPFTCPSCRGALWELEEGEHLRYRCHTGHAYSQASLLLDQGTAVEESLYTAVRAIEEKAAALRRLAERWPENLPQVKRDYEQRAGELERSADVLRAMLAGHRE